MSDELAANLAYCRAVLLPLWEYWTEGNQTARRLLDTGGHDPEVPEMFALLDALELLRMRGRDNGASAAHIAGVAIMAAVLPPELVTFETFVETALNVDSLARFTLGL